MSSDLTQQLLDVNHKLLVAIVSGDWKTYAALCDDSITCFEPEARGQLAVGMAFHKYYFDLPGSPQKPAKNVTMSQPHVRLLGDDAAVLSYVRLTQSLDAAGAPKPAASKKPASGRRSAASGSTCISIDRGMREGPQHSPETSEAIHPALFSQVQWLVGTKRTLRRVLSGTSDAGIRFDDLCSLLENLGFDQRVSGGHHLFRRSGVEEKVNLQRDGNNAKPYQVRQVRAVLLKYQLGERE